MTPIQITNMRLQNQGVAHPDRQSPDAVVAWHGAMQAQDYAHARWAVGLRLPDASDAGISAAIDRGDIIRTHVLRPTWHLVAASDIRWMLDLSAPQIKAACAALNRQLGLDEAIFQRCNEVFRKVLAGGRQLTREELMAELAHSGIAADRHQATHIMVWAELDAVVCNGAHRGAKNTYALFDERVPAQKLPARADALAELARRYFTSHGPATLADFQWWSGLRVADARAGLEAVQHQLISETMDGQVFWMADAPAPKGTPASGLHLLPAFDEFLVSYKDRSASLDTSKQAQAITGNGIFKPVIVSGGRVRGVWRRELKKDTVAIETELFEALSDDEKNMFRAAATRFARFVGKKIPDDF